MMEFQFVSNPWFEFVGKFVLIGVKINIVERLQILDIFNVKLALRSMPWIDFLIISQYIIFFFLEEKNIS